MRRLYVIFMGLLCCAPFVLCADPWGAVQRYLEQHKRGHTAEAESIIAALCWDALPHSPQRLEVRDAQIVAFAEEPVLYPSGRLKSAAWVEQWLVSYGEHLYPVRLSCRVRGGHDSLTLLYVGDGGDGEETWRYKYSQLMEIIRRENPRFYAHIGRSNQAFVHLQLDTRGSDPGILRQIAVVSSEGHSIAYELLSGTAGILSIRPLHG